MLASLTILFFILLLKNTSIFGLDIDQSIYHRPDSVGCEYVLTENCLDEINSTNSNLRSSANFSYELSTDENNVSKNDLKNNRNNNSLFQDFDDDIMENTTKTFIGELDIMIMSEVNDGNYFNASKTDNFFVDTTASDVLNNLTKHNIIESNEEKSDYKFNVNSSYVDKTDISDKTNMSITPTTILISSEDGNFKHYNSAAITSPLPTINSKVVDMISNETEKIPTFSNKFHSQPEKENLKKSSHRHHHHRKNRKHNKNNKEIDNLKFELPTSTTPLASTLTALNMPTNTVETVLIKTTFTNTPKPSTVIDSTDLTYNFYRNESNRKKSGYYNSKTKKIPKYQLVDSFKREMMPENYHDKTNEKEASGKYIYEAKYNFPEAKFSRSNVLKSTENYPEADNHIDNGNYFDEFSKSKTLAESDDITTTSTKKLWIDMESSEKLENDIKGKSQNDIDPKNNLDLLLKYLTKPKPPKGTIMWKARNAPIPLAYFTITVISGPLSRRRRPPPSNKRRVRGARIYLTGLNMPTGYTQITEGSQIKGSNAALVRTLNPQTTGPFVEFKIRVENKYGTSCKQMCLDGNQRYRRCARKVVRLSTYKKFSDPIPFYQTSADAIDGQWTGRGYYRRRKYDYLLFRCD